MGRGPPCGDPPAGRSSGSCAILSISSKLRESKSTRISYDDQGIRDKQGIPFPLLSDLDSEVIRRYGGLNTQIEPEDGFFYGIPYPGVLVTDGDGTVVAKFFHDTYKKRDSAEVIIDAALGRVQVAEDAPRPRGSARRGDQGECRHSGRLRQPEAGHRPPCRGAVRIAGGTAHLW